MVKNKPNKVTKTMISLAIEESEKSDHRHRMGAVIFKKKYIISVGHNRSRSLRSVNQHPKFRRWEHSVHAEMDAIIKARRDLKGTSILVTRINRFGELRYARPCRHCMAYLRYVGIKKIYYSDSSGSIVSEKID